jgi:hypothetical protein
MELTEEKFNIITKEEWGSRCKDNLLVAGTYY